MNFIFSLTRRVAALRLALLVCAVLFSASCTETQFLADMSKRIYSPSSANTADNGRFKVGKPYNIAGRTYVPSEKYDHIETGIASWYGPGFNGKKTASGERFNENELTAAHRTLQMPSLVRVTNLENGRSVVVRVNDRGPFARSRVMDVSKKAAELLGFKNKGTARIKLQVLEEESRYVADLARRGVDTRGMEVAVNRGDNIMPRKASIQSDGRLLENAQGGGNVPALPVPAVQTAALPSHQNRSFVGASGVPGHVSPDGTFYPDPIVTTQAVRQTSLYIQAGSFSQKFNALKLSTSLSRYGPTQVQPVFMSGKTLYRVRVGPVADVSQADQLLNNVVAAGSRDARIIVDEGL